MKITNSSYLSLVETSTAFTQNDVLHFVPTANVDGEALVTIKANDGKDTVSYVFQVNVQNTENAPIAANDSYEVDEDNVLTVDYKHGVLVNDWDIDKNEFSIEGESVTVPQNGTLNLDVSDGSFTYTPNEDFCGVDYWSYTLKDETMLRR